MNRHRVRDTAAGDIYTFATKAKAQAIGLDEDTPTVAAFLHAQTAYINLFETYSGLNTAI